jgi:hypothetical protein
MNHIEFANLCRETSRNLELADLEELGEGAVVEVEGIALQLVLDTERQNSACLFIEMGDVKDEYKAEVYETLFAMQGIFEGKLAAIFDFDNLNNRLLFRVRLPLSSETRGDRLAGVIRNFVGDVTEWRNTLLQDRIYADDDAEDNESNFSAAAENLV